jgi:hypothetical protein
MRNTTYVREIRDAYKIFIGNCYRKRPLGRPTCRWENNTENDIRYISPEGLDWFHLAQERTQQRDTATTVTNLPVSRKARIFSWVIQRRFPNRECDIELQITEFERT